MTTPIARVAITQSELFVGWPAAALAQVVSASDVISHDDGSCLHRPGDEAKYLYVIATGALRLSHQAAPGRGFTAWLQFAGEFHGLGPVLSETPHLYIATCKGQTKLARIPGALLRSMLRRDGKLALAVFAGFHRRYRFALDLYEIASIHGVRARLAALLQSILKRNARARAPLVIRLSQDEIASMLGTRRQVINRELRAIETAGAVRLAYGRITVVDEKLLSGLALRT